MVCMREQVAQVVLIMLFMRLRLALQPTMVFILMRLAVQLTGRFMLKVTLVALTTGRKIVMAA